MSTDSEPDSLTKLIQDSEVEYHKATDGPGELGGIHYIAAFAVYYDRREAHNYDPHGWEAKLWYGHISDWRGGRRIVHQAEEFATRADLYEWIKCAECLALWEVWETYSFDDSTWEPS